ncbi:unnamed protein product [Sphagnum jensenii]|uniref:Transmembrane protein n=1 Tax=Sphagnum jensenii TaxID=128206 RepID=A0ABP1A881_9BRYO
MTTTAGLLQTPGIIGVWNYSISNCSAFRNDTVMSFFKVWPETLDDGFTYCCQDGTTNLSLSNFTYGPTQGALDPRPYFDLGAVSRFKNYWKAWTFWKVPREEIYYPLHCDYTDLHSLYVSRFWRHTVPLGVETGIVLCVILQALVLIVLIVWFCIKKSEERKMLWDGWFRHEKLQRLEEWFWRSGWADFITDLVHLMLLAVIGDCMMEALGHSNLHMWRASIMYNAGAVYSYLTLFAMVSSFLRQLAMCSDITNTSEDAQDASDDNNRESHNLQNGEQSGAVEHNNDIPQSIGASNNHATVADVEDSNSRYEKKQRRIKLEARAWDDALKGLKDVTDDWRWQRVFGQVAVVVLMGTYLSLVDDDTGSSMDSLAGIVLAAVVAASIWSAASTAVVAFRALWLMLLMSTIGQRLGTSRIKTLEKNRPSPDQENGPSVSQRSGSHDSNREPSLASDSRSALTRRMEGGSGGSGRSLGQEPSSPVLRGEEPVEVRLLQRREGSMLRREGSLPKTNPTTTGEELQNRLSGESQRSAVQDATEPSTASQKKRS